MNTNLFVRGLHSLDITLNVIYKNYDVTRMSRVRLLVDLRSIFIGLCSGSFRRCNQDFGVLVEAPIRALYHKYGRKTRLLGKQRKNEKERMEE